MDRFKNILVRFGRESLTLTSFFIDTISIKASVKKKYENEKKGFQTTRVISEHIIPENDFS